MKGIILSGGLGTRLLPLTSVVSKQLLPVYDKPMIYYPLSTLLNADIREIAIISTPHALPQFRELLGEGSRFGVKLTYIIQDAPAGIAQAFLLAKDFIGRDAVTLILGDNIFHGAERTITDCIQVFVSGCSLFGYKVKDPTQYGVATFNEYNQILKIVEKPSVPETNIAITGLYVYDNTVIAKTKSLKPSNRGELEVTDLNNLYIKESSAKLYIINGAWLDMGSPDGLLQAANYVQTLQERQGVQIGCLEEIAFKNKAIGNDKLVEAFDLYRNTLYGEYLKSLSKGI
jgi:glucose-1-phosphate thymidylyltransferase